MNLSVKNLDRICLLAVLIVTVSCGLWASKYSTKKRKQVLLENSLYSRMTNKINQADSALTQLRAMLNESQDRFKSLKARIPESGEIGKFLKQLDTRIKQRKITLITLQPLPVVKERFFTKIPIRLIFKGDFVDTYRLLYDLETMNRLLATEILTITKSGRHEPCRVELTINIFEQ